MTRREAVYQNVCHFRAEVPGRPVRQHGRLREHSAPAKGIQQQLFYPPTIPGLLTDQRFHGAHIEDHFGVLMNEGETKCLWNSDEI